MLAGIGGIVSQIIYGAALDSITESLDEASAELEQDVPADPGTEEEAVDEPSTDMVLGFGETLTYENDFAVGVSAPQPFTPTEYAAGVEGFTQFVRFDVTLTNGTAEAFDPSLVFATLASGGTEASQVFDEGLEGGPSTSLLPGQTVTFPVGFGVTDPADLTLEVAPDAFTYDSAIFSTVS